MGIFLEKDIWTPPAPLHQKMYNIFFFQNMDNKMNLTPKMCVS